MRARTRARCLVFHRRRALPNRHAQHRKYETSTKLVRDTPVSSVATTRNSPPSAIRTQVTHKKRSFVNSIYRKTIHKHPSLLKKTFYVKKNREKRSGSVVYFHRKAVISQKPTFEWRACNPIHFFRVGTQPSGQQRNHNAARPIYFHPPNHSNT